jgi:hypothetical protein
MPERDQMLGDLRRPSQVVHGPTVVVLGPPVPDDVVAGHQKWHTPVLQRAQETNRVCAAQDRAADVVPSGERRRQAEISGRRVPIAAEGHELQVPPVLVAVRLGAQQDERLEFVEIVAIASALKWRNISRL